MNDGWKNLKLFIFEPHIDSKYLYAYVLESAGVTVKAVSIGDEALEALQDYTPDIVVFNLSFSGDEITAFISEVKQLESLKNRKTKYLGLSSFPRYSEQARRLQAEVQKVLYIPTDIDQFIKTVGEMAQTTHLPKQSKANHIKSG